MRRCRRAPASRPAWSSWGEIKNRLFARREGAVGSTVNLAARVQALAPPGAVAIAPQTRQLIGDRFELNSLGQQTLKGIPTPVEVWLVDSVRSGKSRFEARGGTRSSALIGREHEADRLLGAWRACIAGSGKAALVSGEPGIGKSRLLQFLCEETSSVPRVHIALQCSPYHLNTALLPFIDWLRQCTGAALQTDSALWVDCIDAHFRDPQFAPDDAVPLVCALLGAPLGPDYLSGGAGITFMENLNDLQPMSDEVSGSLERQLMRNLAARGLI